MPEPPSLSGSLLLVNLPGSLPKAEAGKPARNPAGICQSPTSALLKWKWSMPNVPISANQQVPMKLHSDLLLWKNGLWLRWSFPIVLYSYEESVLWEFSWSVLLRLSHRCSFFPRSPSDKETCITLYKHINLLCKPDILFFPRIFHRRRHTYFGANLFFQSGSVLHSQHQWTRLIAFLPAFPRTFFWVLLQTLLLVGNKLESIKRKNSRKPEPISWKLSRSSI